MREQNVLHRHRHAIQRRERGIFLPAFFGGARLGQGGRLIDQAIGVDLGVQRRNAGQETFGNFDRRRLATAESGVFDWYTDQPFTPNGCTTLAPCGEGNCSTIPGDSDKNLCSDNSATFYFRIYRPDNMASCDAYAVEVSNAVY